MSLTPIAEAILHQARILDAYTQSANLPPFSFDTDQILGLPAEVEEARKELINQSQKIKRLALGPVGVLMEVLYTVSQPPPSPSPPLSTPFSTPFLPMQT